MHTSHSFARELLKMPDLPILVNEVPADLTSYERQTVDRPDQKPIEVLFVSVQELPNAQS